MPTRLDKAVLAKGLVPTRSQAESYIRMGAVTVNKRVIKKPGYAVFNEDTIRLNAEQQYVSRAGLKLASVAEQFTLNFRGKTVLDVGSSTGGFTDYALQHGAEYVIAVDVGTNQLHQSLRTNPKIELHEQTDIRSVDVLSRPVDYVVIDVSFISLRLVLPDVAKLVTKNTAIIAMVKPQFEAIHSDVKHKGIIKNEKMRREILKEFEAWARVYFKISTKADSQLAGEKGNTERFFMLYKLM